MHGTKDQLREFIKQKHGKLFNSVVNKAKKKGYSGIILLEIAQTAFTHVLDQIDRGKLNWVFKEDQPDAVLYRIFLSKSFNEAERTIANQEKTKGIRYVPKQENLRFLTQLGPSLNLDMENHVIEFNETLTVAINKLPEKDQIIVYMYYVHGYSHKEIADILGITKEAIKQRLYNIRNKLKKLLREYLLERSKGFHN